MSEARELDHSFVGTGHLLIGLLREEKGIAAQVLDQLGFRLTGARQTLREMPEAGAGEDAGDVPAPRPYHYRQTAQTVRQMLRDPAIAQIFDSRRIDATALIDDIEALDG
jgi:hypothetical protein